MTISRILADGVDFHNVGFEGVAVYGAGLEAVAVGIDGIERVVEDLGYARALFDAQAHEGEYAQVGVEHLAGGEGNLRVGAQQGVDLAHEAGVDVQEGVVENLVEVAALLLRQICRNGSCGIVRRPVRRRACAWRFCRTG